MQGAAETRPVPPVTVGHGVAPLGLAGPMQCRGMEEDSPGSQFPWAAATATVTEPSRGVAVMTAEVAEALRCAAGCVQLGCFSQGPRGSCTEGAQ